jgi:hypothetical protein
VLLEFPEHLLAQGISNLSVDAGVLNVLVAQVIGHVLNPAAGFQERCTAMEWRKACTDRALMPASSA